MHEQRVSAGVILDIRYLMDLGFENKSEYETTHLLIRGYYLFAIINDEQLWEQLEQRW